MLGKIIKRINFIVFILFTYVPSIYAQLPINSIYDDICFYDTLYLNKSINNELSEEIVNSIVTSNLNKIFINAALILTLFKEEYQIFLFRNSSCTNKFLSESKTKIYNFKNKIHLFSINGTIEDNISYIKLVIQTKKKFYISFYNLAGNKIFFPEIRNYNFTIKTNIFPYFKQKLFYDEYSIFENQSINIFDENENIFNDICYIYKTRNETKPPELRKHLYYYKYDNDTYPLLESKDNCNLTNISISYENESFILEYTCIHNINLSVSKILINNISILSKEDKETYNGPNSLKDQEKILYCRKETYNNNGIRKNVGFYISLFLLFIAFICWIFLFIQKYDIARKTPIDSPPKKTNTKESNSVSKKKKVNFSSVEILPDSKDKKKKKKKSMIDDSDDNEDNDDDNNIQINAIYKPKKKKKGKKKIKVINDNNEDNNNGENDNNNDLEWYSNNLGDIIDDDNKDDGYNYNSYNNTEIKIKKKKKKGKQKKGKRKKTNEDDNEKAKSDNENETKGIKGKIKSKITNNDNNNNDSKIMSKTISNFPNAYNKLKDNSALQIKNNLNLRRLVIITNLGKNLEENDFNFNDNELIRRGHPFIGRNYNENNSNNNIINSIEINKNNNDKDNMSNEIATNDNLRKNNSLLPILRDTIVNEENNERNKKMTKIVGFEDDSFISNIKRDYLKYEDAVFFDNREYCSLFTHFLKLKNDLINIFCCNYSFAPYSIRLIKFLFFFHFMFYLETLCIGQKYYFKKYFSKEYQSFTEKMNNINITNLTNINITQNLNLPNNINLTNLNNSLLNNKNLSIFDLERYFSIKTIELAKIHYLYTFKYAFARVLIPVAISYISYIFTAILSPRREILKIYLNTELMQKDKIDNYKKISKKYKIIYIIFGALSLLLMAFFFYSITNYFVIFEDAKYDIPQSFLLSGLIRFILDIIIWAIIANIRKLSIESHSYETYGCVRGICEIN